SGVRSIACGRGHEARQPDRLTSHRVHLGFRRTWALVAGVIAYSSGTSAVHAAVMHGALETTAMPRGVVGEIGLVVALVLAASIWPLHTPPIGLHGEAREALGDGTIVRTGNWVLPERNGELPTKPPLFHWIA